MPAPLTPAPHAPPPLPASCSAAAKLDEISRKISVLSSFTEEPEAPAAAAKGKQAAGDDDDDEIEWDEADPEADDEADEEEEDEEVSTRAGPRWLQRVWLACGVPSPRLRCRLPPLSFVSCVVFPCSSAG